MIGTCVYMDRVKKDPGIIEGYITDVVGTDLTIRIQSPWVCLGVGPPHWKARRLFTAVSAGSGGKEPGSGSIPFH